MRCPFCGNVDTQVKDSRPAEDHVAIRRRRYCPSCAGRFTTYERVQLRDLTVVKKNGKREEFDRTKLERSIRIALQKRPRHPLGRDWCDCDGDAGADRHGGLCALCLGLQKLPRS